MTFEIRDPNLRFPRTRTRRTRTSAIVVHHLDAHWDVHRTHTFHQSLGWNGIGYHFHIAMDGTISTGRGLEFVGAHANPPAGANSSMIGIGCEGRYHNVDRSMPDIQFNALVWLIQHLRGIYGNIPIHGHRDLAATACPGQFFPLNEVRTLQFRVAQEGNDRNKKEEAQVARFDRIEDMPTWARPHLEKFTTTLAKDGLPIIRGDQHGNLDLSLDMIRMLVIFERLLDIHEPLS